MGVTAILVATGRIDRLNESIASFQEQDLADKQLIVFSTCFRQSLSGDFPNVTFINARVMTMPMQAKNLAVENALYPTIVLWSEMDYYLPGHLSRVAKHMAGRDWCWFEREFQSDHRKHLRIEQGSESVFAFTREAWLKCGKFQPGINGFDDRNFIARVTKDCVGQEISTSQSEITFIRIGSDEARIACRPTIKSGPIKVAPLLQRDYRSQIYQFLSGKVENKICVVELGRFGDLINILPYLQMIHEEYETPAVCVSQEFMTIFEGVSYVRPWPLAVKNEELGQAISISKEEFLIVINAQIWGKSWSQRRTCRSYNEESWANCGVLNRFEDKNLKPIFDRRDAAREAELISSAVGKSNTKPIILVNSSAAISSPCPACNVILDEVKKLWGEENLVIDLAQVKAHRIYDLLGLFEISACLICIDSAFLHLAQATEIGIIAVTNDKPWAGTIVRRNLVAQTDYEKLDMAKIHEGIAFCLQCKPKQVVSIPKIRKPVPGRIFNLIDKFEDTDQQAIHRKSHAVKSQDDLYENGKLIPIHVWEYPSTADKTLGDPRKLPYLKDLLHKFLDASEDGDICIWCNDDSILHPNIVEYSKFHCSVYGACSFFRSEFGPNPPSLESRPDDYARQSRGRHIGRDAFAFRREWLVQNWDEIPNFCIGASGWDLCMAALIRLTFGIKTTTANLGEQMFPAEPENGLVGHVAHKSLWNLDSTQNSPSNKWNGRLFREWSESHGLELRFTAENNLA